jgi:hypothetical protein
VGGKWIAVLDQVMGGAVTLRVQNLLSVVVMVVGLRYGIVNETCR